MLPVSTAESESFKELLRFMEPNYNVTVAELLRVKEANSPALSIRILMLKI